MSSYKSYNDLGGYRTRSNAGMGVLFVRNSPTLNSNLTGCRPTYSSTTSISRASLAVSARERPAIAKSIHNQDDKLSYKFSGDKVTDGHRLNSIRTSTRDVRMKCPASEKPTVFQKYMYSNARISSSVAEKYSKRIYGREKSREPGTMMRYAVGTLPGSRSREVNRGSGGELRGEEKKPRPEQPPISSRPPRATGATSSRTSREPSPEVTGIEDSPIRVYTRVPNYTQRASSNRRLTSNNIVSTIEADVVDNKKATVELEKVGEIAVTNNDDDNDDDDDDDDDDDGDDDEDEDDEDDEDDDEDDEDDEDDNDDDDEDDGDDYNDDDDEDDRDGDNDNNDDDDDDDGDGDSAITEQDGEGRTMEQKNCHDGSFNGDNMNPVTVTVVTRGTSPEPPASSSFVRNNRADATQYIRWVMPKTEQRIESKDAAIQCDCLGDLSRYARLVGRTRVSPRPSCLDKLHISDRVRNFGYARQSQSPTRPPILIGAAVDPISSLTTDIQLETLGSKSNFVLHNSIEVTDDGIPLNVMGNEVKEPQKLPIHQFRLFDRSKKSISQGRVNSTSPVTSSSSSRSLSSSSRQELVSRSDVATMLCQSKSISRGGTIKNSSKQRQLKRTSGLSDCTAASSATGKSKSASVISSTSQSVKTRTPQSLLTSQCISGEGVCNGSTASTTTSSMNGRDRNNSETREKPPVPRSNDSHSTIKTTDTVIKYINKDFRKSSLNMPDAGDPISKSKYYRERMKSSPKCVPISSYDTTGNINSCSKLSHSPRPRRNSESNSRRKFEKTAKCEPVVVRNSKSSSKPPKNRGSTYSTSSSSETSSESSISESSEGNDPKSSECREQRSINKTLNSLNLERSRKMSVSSSRTSILGWSADDLSLTTDQLPRSISNSKSRGEMSKNESDDIKSSLISTPPPVTNISEPNNNQQVKSMRSMQSRSISKSKTENFTYNMSESENNINHGRNAVAQVKQEYSTEKAWWMDPNLDNIPDGVEKLNQSQDDISEATTVSINLPDDENDNTRVWQQDLSEESWNARNNDNMALKEMSGSLAWQKNSSYANIATPDCKNSLRHQQSGERAWWMSDDPAEVPDGIVIYPSVAANSSISSNNDHIDNSECLDGGETLGMSINRIRHIDSGERAWWMDSNSNIPEDIQKISPEILESHSNSDNSSELFGKVNIRPTSPGELNTLQAVPSISRFPNGFHASVTDDTLLSDRANPEGVERPSECYGGRVSSYNNVDQLVCHLPPHKQQSNFSQFIGNHTNIDDILDGMMSSHCSCTLSQVHKQNMTAESKWDGRSGCKDIDVAGVIIHDSTPKTSVVQRRRRDTERQQPEDYIPLDDTALQLYKDGDYGAYLDLEASISEQQEEFESFQTNRKNSIILRTQLSVRVHTIIEKLLNSGGRELRRALFSLKQIFQEDKDLVHEFVQNDGLACLIKVGNEADQNYQNYILRALGQVMLYVDGMNGVMEHGQTVQWLYALIASRFRLVVKTALKLLLVFVEYIETNSLLLVRAVRSVDTSRGMIPWTNVMKLLKDYDAADTELLIYTTTLVNKCLNEIPDQDTYYDQVDCLEEQGIEGIIQRYMSKQGTDLDLLRQFQIYEAVLHHEDGNDRGSPIRQLDDNIRKTLRNRKCLVDSNERRKSRRHSTGTSPLSMSLNVRLSPRHNHSLGLNSINGSLNSILRDDDDESSSSHSSQGLADVQLNGSYKENKDDVGVTPALRRRRERAERQRSFIREQQEATATMRASVGNLEEKEAAYISDVVKYTNGAAYERNHDVSSNKTSRVNSRKDLTPLMNAANKIDSEQKKPWYGKSHDEGVECEKVNHSDGDGDRRVLVQMKRDGTVKDLTQKLAAQNLMASNTGEEKISRIGDMSGLISKAKEGLAKSKSKVDILKLPSGDNVPKLVELKKSENELHWEELVNQMKRPLALCDLDFTDLNSDDEVDVLGPVNITNGVPPPPPPMVPSSVNGNTRAPPPPPLTEKFTLPFLNASPPIGVNVKCNLKSTTKCPTQTSPKKNKKTVKLFWKEVREDPVILSRLDKNTTIWDELIPVSVDTQKLEHLFESRAKDLITKKQQEMNKNREIIVLDHKRSNTINIGMTKLPPPRSIKTAILKMDATIMSREGIEKLLTMLPTEDERSRIQDAQAANPDLPLGSAEQFLLTLASISELPARLKLWAFKLDFENSEKEIADPLMDLKQGMEMLKMNKTFRGILSTLLSIGIFLNGNEVKGFQLEYLTKVPEVKDTVHKHSLLHHLCHIVMEKFPDSTDLYSEIGAVTRASRIDFDELAGNISKLESECKASWDHLKLIAKHDGSTTMKVKMSDFLADCAERIIVLDIVHRRVINRFHKFILWLGVPLHRVQDTKPNEFCRIVSEFALEYRTTRERVIQQLEKKANHRERNKTRGKMITEVGKFRTKEDRADAELRQLLGSDISDVESIHGTLPWRRQRKEGRTSLGPIIKDGTTNGNVTDGDDELLESLVKTATKSPASRATPRERKRTRHADRKSLRRTLKSGLSEEEKKHIAAYIKGY